MQGNIFVFYFQICTASPNGMGSGGGGGNGATSTSGGSDSSTGTNGSGGSDKQHPLLVMMKDQYANYVVQKMLDLADGQQRKKVRKLFMSLPKG